MYFNQIILFIFDKNYNYMGEFFYWIWILCLSIANIVAIRYIIKASRSDYSDFVDYLGPVVLLILCGAIQYASLTYIPYTEKEIDIIEASAASIMHDDEEAIVKYVGRRWEIKKIKIYNKIINGDFYFRKVEDFNVFGKSIGYTHSLELYEHEKPSDKSIPIEL